LNTAQLKKLLAVFARIVNADLIQGQRKQSGTDQLFQIMYSFTLFCSSAKLRGLNKNLEEDFDGLSSQDTSDRTDERFDSHPLQHFFHNIAHITLFEDTIAYLVGCELKMTTESQLDSTASVKLIQTIVRHIQEGRVGVGEAALAPMISYVVSLMRIVKETVQQ